jgi:O-antigen/teichoic acid export membrane protein
MITRIASTFIIKILIAIINLAMVVIISQWLGAAGKGETSLIITSIVIIIFVCNIVGGDTLVYLAPRHSLFQLLILSTIWTAIVCISAYFIFINFELFDKKWIPHIVLLSFINALFSANITLLISLKKIVQSNIISLVQVFVNLICMVVFCYFFTQKNTAAYIQSLYLSFGFALLASTIAILPFLKFTKLMDSKKVVKQMFHLGISNQLGHILQFVNFRLSYYLLSHFSGYNSVGVYSNGTSIAESLWLISNSIALIQYTEIANSIDIKQSQTITSQFVRMSLLLCFFALIAMLLIPGQFYVFLFGTEFFDVKEVVLFLIPGVIFYNVFLIIGHYFSGIGNFYFNTFSNFLGLLITIIMSLIFVLVFKSYTVQQAAIICSTSYLITMIFIVIQFVRKAEIRIVELIPSSKDLGHIKYYLQQKFFSK